MGVVLVAGWPMAEVASSAGDTHRQQDPVRRWSPNHLSKRFAFRQVVFVGNGGMVTEKNLQVLQKAEGAWGFLWGMTRRQNAGGGNAH